MTATTQWENGRVSRAALLRDIGAFWYHDGNPNRPYVRLRSGLISNGYFNGAQLCERPVVLDAFSKELVTELETRSSRQVWNIDRVVGPAMGAITFAHSVASKYFWQRRAASNILTSFAEKDGDGFVFKLSAPRPRERILLVEDTVTTGGSVLKVRDAVLAAAPDIVIEPYLLSFCNRSGSDTLDGMEIISLVDGNFKTWKEDENPFTDGGRELVPVVENAKNNWDVLTRDYA